MLSALFCGKVYGGHEECVSEMPPDPSSHCCGVDAIVTDRIIGGEPAALRQFPWLALVEYSKKNGGGPAQLFCGAFLISSRYVVTAAHCVTGSITDENENENENEITLFNVG
ncbi:hypothetical protein O0L34_g1761 [Tuta absoluta]|nr:hypothetical protein O0L34_g1761 [Tuta absoluta]